MRVTPSFSPGLERLLPLVSALQWENRWSQGGASWSLLAAEHSNQQGEVRGLRPIGPVQTIPHDSDFSRGEGRCPSPPLPVP